MKIKLYFRYWTLATLIMWASYFAIYLIACFYYWEFSHPFKIFLDLPNMSVEDRLGFITTYLIIEYIKLLAVNYNVNKHNNQ